MSEPSIDKEGANMVAEEMVNLKADILDRIEHRLGKGESLDSAVAVVQREIIVQRQAERFVEEFGAQTIRDLWRMTNRGDRTQAMNGGSRRHDPVLLGTEPSLFDALYKVGDAWVCLGDFTKAMCQEGHGFFRAQAAGNMREAYMFTQLARKLHKDETVRTRFTEDEVRAILDAFKF